MFPRPGAEEAVSKGMPSSARIRAKNRMVWSSFPGGLVVLIRRYSSASLDRLVAQLGTRSAGAAEPPRAPARRWRRRRVARGLHQNLTIQPPSAT